MMTKDLFLMLWILSLIIYAEGRRILLLTILLLCDYLQLFAIRSLAEFGSIFAFLAVFVKELHAPFCKPLETNDLYAYTLVL